MVSISWVALDSKDTHRLDHKASYNIPGKKFGLTLNKMVEGFFKQESDIIFLKFNLYYPGWIQQNRLEGSILEVAKKVWQKSRRDAGLNWRSESVDRKNWVNVRAIKYRILLESTGIGDELVKGRKEGKEFISHGGETGSHQGWHTASCNDSWWFNSEKEARTLKGNQV